MTEKLLRGNCNPSCQLITGPIFYTEIPNGGRHDAPPRPGNHPPRPHHHHHVGGVVAAGGAERRPRAARAPALHGGRRGGVRGGQRRPQPGAPRRRRRPGDWRVPARPRRARHARRVPLPFHHRRQLRTYAPSLPLFSLRHSVEQRVSVESHGVAGFA